MASVPETEQPVPVVMLIVPAVSLPETVIVGVVQAAAPSVLVGVVPAVSTWPPFRARLVLTVSDAIVMVAVVLSTDIRSNAEAFWIFITVELSVVGFSNALLPPMVTAPVLVPVLTFRSPDIVSVVAPAFWVSILLPIVPVPVNMAMVFCVPDPVIPPPAPAQLPMVKQTVPVASGKVMVLAAVADPVSLKLLVGVLPM